MGDVKFPLLDGSGKIGADQVPDLSGSYASLTKENAFTVQQGVNIGSWTSQPALHLGTGLPRGAPTGTITAVTNGAGAVTSSGRIYAYTETDNEGETTLSPASVALALSAQQAKLTVPSIRPGFSDRIIYASDDSGATWHKLGAFNVSGNLHYGQVYLDNNAAPLSGVAAPTTDSTSFAALTINNDGMMYARRTEHQSDVVDLTMLMANVTNGGSGNIDSYGNIRARGGGSAQMPCYTADVLGTADAFAAYWGQDDGVGANPGLSFHITGKGQLIMPGNGQDWGNSGIILAPTAAQTAATSGLLAITVPSGSTNHGQVITNNGTGYGLNIQQNAAQVGLHVAAGSGAAGKYVAQFVGQDYGVECYNTGEQPTLTVAKAGTGAATALSISNSGTGPSISAPSFTVSKAGGIGVFGHAAPASQPATPVTLADVIALLQSYGLSA